MMLFNVLKFDRIAMRNWRRCSFQWLLCCLAISEYTTHEKNATPFSFEKRVTFQSNVPMNADR